MKRKTRSSSTKSPRAVARIESAPEKPAGKTKSPRLSRYDIMTGATTLTAEAKTLVDQRFFHFITGTLDPRMSAEGKKGRSQLYMSRTTRGLLRRQASTRLFRPGVAPFRLSILPTRIKFGGSVSGISAIAWN
jgi:hypothetical protein